MTQNIRRGFRWKIAQNRLIFLFYERGHALTVRAMCYCTVKIFEMDEKGIKHVSHQNYANYHIRKRTRRAAALHVNFS